MRELNVTLKHSDKYCQKQQRPGSLGWRKEAGVESEPDLKLAHTTAEKLHFLHKKKQGLLESHISLMQQQNIITK